MRLKELSKSALSVKLRTTRELRGKLVRSGSSEISAFISQVSMKYSLSKSMARSLTILQLFYSRLSKPLLMLTTPSARLEKNG